MEKVQMSPFLIIKIQIKRFIVLTVKGEKVAPISESPPQPMPCQYSIVGMVIPFSFFFFFEKEKKLKILFKIIS